MEKTPKHVKNLYKQLITDAKSFLLLLVIKLRRAYQIK